ncbi:leucine-rich repeat domain-containing protein [Fulvivirga sedimenti]|uniref:Leucine-rich repeat domain-containing protein n=1 Tax=Fulvivirga sedimenti TaxID=2879465 RepID=A0A9X1HNN1_9BACT|nr:leucine-rich repeat domain-containing protein [Fulvivirga sedimenti]MCA6075493.1 leucine-rich repeat domain-containing protein [Fulvivirga sedimenti]MCA6076670.1 leucine-rich repeat domain-containing protein [Fulvivirga sedimenti]MCA6077798.1 leucine-rich repeat domain-containing protein [Fulvivirga sedimenti]
MKNKFLLLAFMLLIGPLTPIMAQEEEEQKIRDIVSFLEYMLNTLGDPQTSARDKDVIVTESYSKIFRDGTVQVEDDLDENRDVVTNKDVQAYLKDVNFFFKTARFDFEWQDMEVSENEQGETYYKVSLLRNLQAISVTGDTINQTLPRFVEINLNTDAQDLRIASIYTNELNQDDVWMNWWDNLSLEWQSIFKRETGSIDDLELSQIKKLANIEELDLEGNRFIVDVEPLSRISQLKNINLSHTQVTDISPIRNLNKLQSLDISHTGVSSIDALKYARSLITFHLDHTPVQDIEVIGRMPALETLTMNGTFVTDFSPIASAVKLKHLTCAYTELSDFSSLNSLTSLETLNINGTDLVSAADLSGLQNLNELYADSTLITSLSPLSALKKLAVLSVNHTGVNDLGSLSDLKSLKRVYCDYSGVTLTEARSFMDKNPKVLVVFESEDLITWWDQLPPEWKDVFISYVSIGENAEKEELANMVRLDSLDISDNMYIQSFEPLSRLIKLEYLNAANTAVNSLSPLSGKKDLHYIDISGTQITDLSPLEDLINLSIIRASKTNVSELGLVRTLPQLELINVDETGISDTAMITMARMRPETLIIYKTRRLETWWSQLNDEWKQIFSSQMTMSATPDTEELHRLISLHSIKISDASIADIHPLKEFIRLKELKVSGTRIRSLSPLSFLSSLESLDVSRNPLEDITGIKSLSNLHKLDISNTPVDDLRILSSLYRIEVLNCSGTQIKGLDGLERLSALNNLDCSNTSVKKLDPVYNLGLEILNCYNTRISSKRIDEFKQLNPECDVSFY